MNRVQAVVLPPTSDPRVTSDDDCDDLDDLVADDERGRLHPDAGRTPPPDVF